MTEQIEVTSVEELKALLARFDDDALYRGQVKHYGSQQAPMMNTSFSRQGCHPPSMLKWLHYAKYALSTLIGPRSQSAYGELTQAILQHYGWRSWYLDASSDPAVSSWFACHTFNKQPTIEMLEDCFETGVMLVREAASYAPSEGTGHLYVLSRTRLADSDLQTIDLSAISLPSHRPRFDAQSAWVVGPLMTENLPSTTILAHIEGPAEVFKAFSRSGGLADTASVFPSMKEDPVLAILMSLPWNKIRLPDDEDADDQVLDFFERALSLPEYSREGYRKIMPPHYAFYRNTSIADALQGGQVYVHSVDEIAMYGHADPTMQFPHVTELLTARPSIAFEVDALIRLPESGPAQHYGKGISVVRADDGTIAVGDLVVDHPGLQLTGVAVNTGWHYTADEKGVWTRIVSKDDCPCLNAWRHEHHLSALTIIEHYLGNAKKSHAASAP